MRGAAVFVSPAGHPGAGADAAAGLAQELAARGVAAFIAPDIYWLRREDAWAQELRRYTGSVVLASWLQPRAAFWTLAALGVKGTRAQRLPHADDWRAIVCLNAAEYPMAGACADAIIAAAGGAGIHGAPKLLESGRQPAERWYPVIDYDRCTDCGQCLEFCLFGVYGRDDGGHVVVAAPDVCKPGCPACARVCPSQAIMFPLCDDPGIAGAERATIRPFSHKTLMRIKELHQAHRATAARQGGARDSIDDMLDGLTGDGRRE